MPVTFENPQQHKYLFEGNAFESRLASGNNLKPMNHRTPCWRNEKRSASVWMEGDLQCLTAIINSKMQTYGKGLVNALDILSL